jgi:hypothetical protein
MEIPVAVDAMVGQPSDGFQAVCPSTRVVDIRFVVSANRSHGLTFPNTIIPFEIHQVHRVENIRK